MVTVFAGFRLRGEGGKLGLNLSLLKSFNQYSMVILSLGAVTVFYMAGLPTPKVLILASNPLLLALLIAAFTSATLTARKYNWSLRGRIPQIWMLICYATAFLLATQLGRTLYPYITGVMLPYPFITTDFFLLVSYLLIAAALTLYAGTFIAALSRETLTLISATAATSGFLISYMIILPAVILGLESSVYLFDLALTLASLIVFILALTGLAIFLEGRLEKAWMLLTLAAICLTLHHFMLAYLDITGLSGAIHLANLPAAWGIILLTLAFHNHRKEF